MTRCIHYIVAMGWVALTSATLAASGWSQDPEPFRREDEIAGRDMVYRKNVFMHWFTYRPRLERSREWNRTREGLLFTTGSINANRLYLYEELQKRFPLNSTFFATFRHRADEDFDGEYTRTLTGVGSALGNQWSAALFGDFTSKKEDIDASVELEWRSPNDSRFRIALVAVDALHDQKTELAEYEQAPFTLFTEYTLYTDGGLECGAWVNWNTPLELHVEADGLEFEYEQLSFGANCLYPIGESAHVLAELGGENGTRAWRETFDSVIGTRDLDRSHAHMNVEAEWRLTHATRMWLGYRYFVLTERYGDDYSAEGNGEIDRNENMLHAGIKYRFREHIVFWPGLYVNQIDLHDTFPEDSDREWASEGLVGKLSLPLEIEFDNGGAITFSISFRTDILRSGGYNAQLYLPF
jgi:hypothetical protein